MSPPAADGAAGRRLSCHFGPVLLRRPTGLRRWARFLPLLPALVVACDRSGDDPGHAPRGEAEREPAVTPAPAPVGAEPKVHAVGELATAPHYTMRVSEVTECAVEAPFQPKQGYKKLGVEVVIEGATETEVPVNPFYATLRDASGETYRATLAGCKPPLEAVRVTQDRRARGFINFDVRRTARGLSLAYEPIIIGGGAEPLLFDLPH